MYERILVALDHSAVSDHVLAAAKELASMSKAKVWVLHLREREVIAQMGDVPAETSDEATQGVDRAVKELTGLGVEAHGEVRNTTFGHAAREIMKDAKEHDRDHPRQHRAQGDPPGRPPGAGRPLSGGGARVSEVGRGGARGGRVPAPRGGLRGRPGTRWRGRRRACSMPGSTGPAARVNHHETTISHSEQAGRRGTCAAQASSQRRAVDVLSHHRSV